MVLLLVCNSSTIRLSFKLYYNEKEAYFHRLTAINHTLTYHAELVSAADDRSKSGNGSRKFNSSPVFHNHLLVCMELNKAQKHVYISRHYPTNINPYNMKKLQLIILFVLTYSIGQAQTKNFIDQPYIEVSGSADTLITPNEIFIRILLSEKDTRDKVSIEEQERRMVNALKALGLETEKDLTTADMSSSFKSYLLKSKDVVKNKLYMLKVRDAVTASKVFIKLEELEISNTAIERVGHSALESIQNTMRANAIASAKERAVAMTKPLNQTVGHAIHIADAENFSNQLQGRLAEVVVRGVDYMKNNETELPKIEFEKIKVAANVSIKFILK